MLHMHYKGGRKSYINYPCIILLEIIQRDHNKYPRIWDNILLRVIKLRCMMRKSEIINYLVLARPFFSSSNRLHQSGFEFTVNLACWSLPIIIAGTEHVLNTTFPKSAGCFGSGQCTYTLSTHGPYFLLTLSTKHTLIN